MTRPVDQPKPYPGDQTRQAAPISTAASDTPATRPEPPQAYAGDRAVSLPGTVRYQRTYRDVLGRPMTGRATITGSTTPGDPVNDSARDLVIAASVSVEVVDGVLNVELPPDTYRIDALLRTSEGNRVTHTDIITLTA